MANDDADSEEPKGRPASDHSGGATPKRRFGFLDTDPFKDQRSPLIGRFLRDYIERLEDDVAELKPYRDKYYDVKSKLDVHEERKTLTRTAAGVSSILLALGGLGVGVAKDISELDVALGIIIAIASAILVFSAFQIRVKG